MADEKSPQYEESPFRRDITFEELAALLNGATIDDIFEARDEEKVTSEATTTPAQSHSVAEVVTRPEGVSTIKVHQVADTFVREDTPKSVASEAIDEAAADVQLPASSELPTQLDEPASEIDVAPAVSPASETITVSEPSVLPEAFAEEAETLAEAPIMVADELTTVPEIETDLVDDSNAESRMLRGSAWMTIGSLASRVLGAL